MAVATLIGELSPSFHQFVSMVSPSALLNLSTVRSSEEKRNRTIKSDAMGQKHAVIKILCWENRGKFQALIVLFQREGEVENVHIRHPGFG